MYKEEIPFGACLICQGRKPLVNEDKIYMPIIWLPLGDIGNNLSLFISKFCLDFEAFTFNTDRNLTSYSESFLKKNIATKMWDRFFTEEEKNAILKTPCGRLFLPTERLIRKYFPNENDAKAQILITSREKNGSLKITLENSSYWLMSQEKLNITRVPIIDAAGELTSIEGWKDEVGIRLCMLAKTNEILRLSNKYCINPFHEVVDDFDSFEW